MRKQRIRKLVLSRESLRSLATPDLRDAAGGISYDNTVCHTCLKMTVCRSCIPPC